MRIAAILAATFALAACGASQPTGDAVSPEFARYDSLRVLRNAVLTHAAFTATKPTLRLCNASPEFADYVGDSIPYLATTIDVLNECVRPDSSIAVHDARMVIRLDSMFIKGDSAMVYFRGRAFESEWWEQIALNRVQGHVWSATNASLHSFSVD